MKKSKMLKILEGFLHALDCRTDELSHQEKAVLLLEFLDKSGWTLVRGWEEDEN